MKDPKIPLKQRKRILERDGNKCVLCWRKYQLHIHHHWDFSGSLKKFDDWNGNAPYINTRDCDLITLCAVCHGKVHTAEKGSPIYQFVTDYLSKFNEGPLLQLARARTTKEEKEC